MCLDTRDKGSCTSRNNDERIVIGQGCKGNIRTRSLLQHLSPTKSFRYKDITPKYSKK